MRLDVFFHEQRRRECGAPDAPREHLTPEASAQIDHHEVGDPRLFTHRFDVEEAADIGDIVRIARIEPKANDGRRSVARRAVAPNAEGTLSMRDQVALLEWTAIWREPARGRR